jgi:hypothetical protein
MDDLESRSVETLRKVLDHAKNFDYKTKNDTTRHTHSWTSQDLRVSLILEKRVGQGVLWIPPHLGDLVANYIGFHEAYRVKEVFCALIPVTINTWSQFHPLHDHLAVESPRRILTEFAQVTSEKVVSEFDHPFLHQMLAYSLVYENGALATYLEFFLQQVSETRDLYSIWKSKFLAAFIREDLDMFTALSKEYVLVNGDQYVLPDKWLFFEEKRNFLTKVLHANIASITNEFLWRAFIQVEAGADESLLHAIEQCTPRRPYRRAQQAMRLLHDADYGQCKSMLQRRPRKGKET